MINAIIKELPTSEIYFDWQLNVRQTFKLPHEWLEVATNHGNDFMPADDHTEWLGRCAERLQRFYRLLTPHKKAECPLVHDAMITIKAVISELAASITEPSKMLDEVDVTDDHFGRYLVLEGYHRYTLHALRGFERVRCRLRTDDASRAAADNAHRFKSQAALRNRKLALRPQDVLAAVITTSMADGVPTRSELCEGWGLNTRTAATYLPVIRVAVADPRFTNQLLAKSVRWMRRNEAILNAVAADPKNRQAINRLIDALEDAGAQVDVNIAAEQRRLSELLGRDVTIHFNERTGQGEITLRYSGFDDYDALMTKFGIMADEA